MSKGVSVILCCYDSSSIIEETLHYLFKQRFSEKFDWEIILVNNASTDNTEEIGRKLFASQKNIQYKIVTEEKPGLIHARKKGIETSQYEFLLYCDDDNLLCETYIQTVYTIMNSNDTIGACGGRGLALIKGGEKPEWFNRYSRCFAIGSQKGDDGHIKMLYGAGICIRKSALDAIYKKGFVSYCTGRKGNILLAGEDSELTCAIRLRGYTLFADDNLLFQHVISPKRLTVEYLKRMNYGFGMAYAVNFLYLKALKETKIKSLFFLIMITVFRICCNSFFNDLEHQVLLKKNRGIIRGVLNFNLSFFKIKIIIIKLKEV